MLDCSRTVDFVFPDHVKDLRASVVRVYCAVIEVVVLELSVGHCFVETDLVSKRFDITTKLLLLEFSLLFDVLDLLFHTFNVKFHFLEFVFVSLLIPLQIKKALFDHFQ